jgi:hypothetical protein
MMLEGFHQQVMIDVVKESSDVELDNPVILPATFSRYCNRIMG